MLPGAGLIIHSYYPVSAFCVREPPNLPRRLSEPMVMLTVERYALHQDETYKGPCVAGVQGDGERVGGIEFRDAATAEQVGNGSAWSEF